MTSINGLLAELDETEIARNIGVTHDEARMRYPLNSVIIENFAEFRRIIADYYNYHFGSCVAGGGTFDSDQAYSMAYRIIDEQYRKHNNGDIQQAIADARDGTNGGMRAVLDALADGIKLQAIERHVRAAFDRYVAPNSWDDQVEIIRQFLGVSGALISPSIDRNRPERYARDYEKLIRTYAEGLQRSAAMFRRL